MRDHQEDGRTDVTETLGGASAAICSLPHLETLVTYWWRLTSLNMSEPQWLSAEELDMWTVGTACAAVSAVILLCWLKRGHSVKVSLRYLTVENRSPAGNVGFGYK